ncbi:MAG: glycoside hydrolase family 43 protein [Prolixibacteraceae bacterium]|jgi:GH43 family beta-xylosidase|nr:glycoside hydrolase family 43 protein [Prolixibacteraceae bacterium]
MKLFQFSKLALVVLMAITLFGACSQPQEEIKFDNPLAWQRADPCVHKTDDGIYHLIATAPEYDRIEIKSAETINGLAKAEPVVVWQKHDSGSMGYHIWAPELHRFNGKWYIYFAAAEAEDIWKIRMWVLSNDSDDPKKGTWVEEGQIKTERDAFALDATTFEHKGQRYLVWAEKTRRSSNSGLIIAKMKDPVTLEGPEVVITEPEYEWEMHTYKVNEGAAVLKRNGKIFITFSGSATDATYAMGLLWADEDADLLDPSSWNKLPNPVFYTNEELKRFGPGHNSFTVTEDGKTDVLIYHARDYKEIEGASLSDPNRHTRARTFSWTEDGFPDFRQEIGD